MQPLFEGIFREKNQLWTQNMVPGQRVYGEKLETVEGKEFRNWNPFKSKLASAIQNGLKEMPIQKGSNVLYLGSAEGTTVSHLSDIIQDSGIIVGIDSSARVMPKFLKVCEQRPNIIPLLADANQPGTYAEHLEGIKIGVLYQDVAQPNQAGIFLKNASFLEKNGKGLLVLKAASIDSAAKPQKVFEQQTKELKPTFDIIQTVSLEPFQTSHAMVYCEKK